MKTTRTVHQVGYGNYTLNTWAVCGWGKTLDEAKAHLEGQLHQIQMLKGKDYVDTLKLNNQWLVTSFESPAE